MELLKNIFLISMLLFVTACDDDDEADATPDDPAPLEAQIVNDIAADPQPPGPPTGEAPDYTLFSFETGAVVSDADSASTSWDIGLAGLRIILNGGVNGPGSTEAQVLTGLFDEISEAPEAGFVTDTETSNAIPMGSGNGWYNYNLNGNNVVSPIPGRVIVVKTNDDNYVKFEILNYYQGSPDITSEEFLNNQPPGRYYSIRFVYQPDGSRNL